MFYDHLEPVIGLEIHVQLKTRRKLFSSVDNHADGAKPNTLISAIDVGHPGTLPQPNPQAMRFATRIGLALGATIQSPVIFDRKHYLYPDLPKGYQITQYDHPICADGRLVIEDPQQPERTFLVRIERAHLEEDAAKNIHSDGKTLVDFNRAGTPLVEIVTRPDLRTPQDAKLFLQELRRVLRAIGVSDADMEKGHMRCDANVSLRPVHADGSLAGDELYPKTEVKNMNSFRSVERALLFEIQRQTDLWQAATPPTHTTTRGWSEATQTTEEQRKKELAEDYRYLREPDIQPINIDTLIQEETGSLSELPAARRARFQSEYGVSRNDAWTLTDDSALADFTERCFGELYAWLIADPAVDVTEQTLDHHIAPLGKLAGPWIGAKLLGLLNEHASNIRIAHLSPENMAELLALLYTRRLTAQNGLRVLDEMLAEGDSPAHIVNQLGLTTVDDIQTLGAVVDLVLSRHPNEVQAYKAGKVALLQFFVGMVQKETQGQANPVTTRTLLESRLTD